MALAVGTKLGPYQVISLLGSGGMGEVYRARDTRLQRDVAIKVLPPSFAADSERLQRFEREAHAAGRLNHPNLLVVHDIGSQDGFPYLVSELLEGETLRERLVAGGLHIRKAMDCAAQLADGLAAAHEKSIVHRDLKPENVFLTTDGRVKILDFGLARLVPATTADSKSPTESYATLPGTILGSVSYMSPEQLRGREVDHRSDIFSFGIVLFEMACGQRPFQGVTVAETTASILKDDPPPPAQLVAQIPPELDRVILHCLEKNPDERFQSARDLAFALKALASDRVSSGEVTAAPTGSIDSLAVLPFVNASADSGTEYLSDGITESLIYSLSRLPGLKVLSRSSAFRYKGRDLDSQAAGRELNVRAVLTGRVTQRGDSLLIQTELVDVANGWQLWGERYNRSFEDVFAVQEEIAKEISEKLQLRLTGRERQKLAKRQTEDPEAYQLYLRGRYHWNKRNEEAVRKGISYFQRAIERDPAYSLPYVGLADSYNILGFYSFLPPREAFPKAKAAAARALELDDSLAEAHASMAYAVHYYDWDWSAAERGFLRAIELDQNYATAHHFYATHLAGRARFEEALREIQRARELDPLSLIIGAGLGVILYYARRYDETIEECRKVLEMDPGFVPAHIWLAWAYAQTAMAEVAVEECRKALQVSNGSILALAELGAVLAASGQKQEAEDILRELSELEGRSYVSPYYRAEIYAGLGSAHDALIWLERSCAERSTSLVWLDVNPRFDALRSDPRFVDVARQVAPVTHA
jgi:serine/threonine protein kinase/tetratricopeptide (TPR) repeat protein